MFPVDRPSAAALTSLRSVSDRGSVQTRDGTRRLRSNDSFSGWTKTFTDPRLCAAIVDRLTFGGNIIETGSSSYRLACV